MTEAKQSFAAKLGVAFVAAAMVFTFAAPAAHAQQSADDLQQMINDLLAQVATLQAQLGQEGGGSTADVCPYTWTRDLSQGSTGDDVMNLQQFLNEDPDTRVAAAGNPGSAGMETDYYGPATAAAVSKFQVMHRADILTPVGLQNPTGYFGPSSRAKANELCVAPAPTPDPDEDEDGSEDEDEDGSEDEDEEEVTLGGVATLGDFEVNDPSDTDVQEGQSDVEIGTFEIEFDNGDAEISYLDIALEGATGNNGDDDPWDNFENVSLWVDGDKIAEVDADDEDDYLDEDAGELRFSNLGLIAMEDEEMEIVVAATLQDNLDGVNDGEDWELYAVGMRFFDADGVATTERGQDDLQDDKSGAAAEFTIEEAGEGEGLKISIGSSDPDPTNIIVDEDSDTNDVTIFAFDIEAEEGDIELDKMVVRVDTTGASTTDVVDDAYIELDGMTFKAERVDTSLTGAPSTMDSRLVTSAGTAVYYVFDIDGDVTIDEDDEMEAVFTVDLNSQSGNYLNGQQIAASVTSTETNEWDAEGADDLVNADYSGTATGEDHTLVAEGIVVPADGVSTDTDTQGTNDTTGVFDIDFEVTAVEGDFYITEDVFEDGNSATTGVQYKLDVPSGSSAATSSGVLSSTADEDTAGVFTVREGETETFTLKVTVDADVTGQYRVSLTEVNYTDQTDGVSPGNNDSYTPTPVQDFRTSYQSIQDS